MRAHARRQGEQVNKLSQGMPLCARVRADKIEAAAAAGTAVEPRHVRGCAERFLPAACQSLTCTRVHRKISPRCLPVTDMCARRRAPPSQASFVSAMCAGAPKDFSPPPAGRRHARTPPGIIAASTTPPDTIAASTTSPDTIGASAFCVYHVRGRAPTRLKPRQSRELRSSAAIRAAPKTPRRIRARRTGAQACRRARRVL